MLFDALGTVKGGFDWFLGSYATLTGRSLAIRSEDLSENM